MICEILRLRAKSSDGLEIVGNSPANTQFLKAGGAVSVDGKHDKRLQLLIDVWATLPNVNRERLIILISDQLREDR